MYRGTILVKKNYSMQPDLSIRAQKKLIDIAKIIKINVAICKLKPVNYKMHKILLQHKQSHFSILRLF